MRKLRKGYALVLRAFPCFYLAMSVFASETKLLTIKEVASVLQVPRARAYKLVRSGVIPGMVRLGKQVRIDPERLQGFIRHGGQPLCSDTSRS